MIHIASHCLSVRTQGDVGSGKTVVSLLSMLLAVESGAQACILAPTEVLAHQHFNTFTEICALQSVRPVRVALLTGAVTGQARASLLPSLADGSRDILVGTPAVYGHHVRYKGAHRACMLQTVMWDATC